METYQFFKANIADKGYSRSWFNKPLGSVPVPGTTIIENSLPHPDTKASSLPVAYAASQIGVNQILIAVGSYWPEHSDQYGRPGLSFWHGALCVVQWFDTQELLKIANLLLALVQRYESGYETVGKLVTQLAVKESDENWMKPFSRLMSDSAVDINGGTRLMMDRFVDHLDQIPKSANLQLGFPLEREFAIPLLLTSLAHRKDVMRVGGGSLANITPDQAQQISVPKDIPGYETFQISSLPLFKDRERNEPMARVAVTQSSKREEAAVAKNRKLLLLAVAEGLIILLMVVIILWPDPLPEPVAAVCKTDSTESQLLVSVRLNEAQSKTYDATIIDGNNQPLVSQVRGSCSRPSEVKNQLSETSLDCVFRFDQLRSTQTIPLDSSLLLGGLEENDRHEIPVSTCLN